MQNRGFRQLMGNSRSLTVEMDSLVTFSGQ
jgi:hypothetical protein